MPYDYDVFLSYSRKPTHSRWVNETFIQLFTDFLGDAANTKNLRIFHDTKEIGSSDGWPERIKNALARSKCMVAIWSPAYFNSEWCLRELAAMRYREKRLGLRTKKNPAGLIHPVKIFDGDHFPDYIDNNQCQDFRDYFLVGEGFSKTPLFTDFQTMLQTWVVDVAAGILKPPKWDSKWSNKVWLDKPYEELPKPKALHAKKPNL